MERARLEFRYKRRTPLKPCILCDGVGTIPAIDLRPGALWRMRGDSSYYPPVIDEDCGFCKGTGKQKDHEARRRKAERS